MNYIFTVLLFLVTICQVYSQSDILDNYIEIGKENNLSQIQENLKVERTNELTREARGKFLPNLSLQSQYTLAGGGRTIDIPLGDLINPVHNTLNQLTESNQFPGDLQNRQVMFLPDNFHETRFRMIQPIINSNILYNYKAKQEMASLQKVKREAFINELTKEIKIGYFNYLKAKQSLKILRKQRKLLQKSLKINQSLVRNHKATKDKIYQAQYALDELAVRIADVRQKINTSKSQFNFLLNRNLNESIRIDTFTLPDRGYDSVAILQTVALENRPEISSVEKGILLSEIEISRNEANKFLPQLGFSGEIGYQGFDWQFGSEQEYYLLAFTLKWNIFNGWQRDARVEQAKISENLQRIRLKELEKQIKVQVVNSYFDLQAAHKKYQAAKSSRKNAQQRFDIIKTKYRENKVLFLEYLDARTKLENASISANVAKYDFFIQKANLENALGNF